MEYIIKLMKKRESEIWNFRNENGKYRAIDEGRK